jgi:hypothetical protein
MRQRFDAEAEIDMVAAILFSFGMMSSIVVACFMDGNPRPRV